MAFKGLTGLQGKTFATSDTSRLTWTCWEVGTVKSQLQRHKEWFSGLKAVLELALTALCIEIGQHLRIEGQ
ncbi:hypothetical protein E4U22_007375 [Claviceps purpurea]|nr:hypothetical protein E4U22_007375 [Claviceps purpurea]